MGNSSNKGCCGSSKLPPEMMEDENPPPPRPSAMPEVTMGSPLEQTDDDLNPEEKAAHHKPHRCTDFSCSLVFFLGLFGITFVLKYAQENADLRRLYHGIDWDGSLCGVDKEVEDKPYLYWCAKGGSKYSTEELAKLGFEALGQDGDKIKHDDLIGSLAVLAASNSLDLGSPICVSKCPENDKTQHACFQDSESTVKKNDVSGDFTREISYDMAFVQDYAASEVAERYCIPQTVDLLKSLDPLMQVGWQYVVFHASEVASAWPVIATTAGLAVIFGYVHLLLVKKLAAPVVWGTIALACLLPLAAGIYGLYTTFSSDLTELLQERLELNATDLGAAPFVLTTGNKTADTAVSSSLVVLSLLITIAACLMKGRIAVVLESIEAAFDCMWDMPGMLLQPLIAAIPKVLYLFVALGGLGWLLSVGKVEKYHPHDMVPKGVMRTFVLTPDEQLMVGFYSFMAIWVLELLLAIDHFAFAYATSRWYFMDHDRDGRKPVSKFAFGKGYFLAYTYHFGSLAMGSFLLSAFRVVQWLMVFVQQRMKEAAGEDEKATAAIACTTKACCCCMACFEKLIRFLNKETYLVVAVESVGFCDGAQRAFNIMLSEAATLGTLSGATNLFQVGGLVTITGAGTWCAWLLCRHTQEYSDPASASYVSAPELVAGIGGVISLLVALCFTFVFGDVCDSMLMCWALDQRLKSESGAVRSFFAGDSHTPPKVKALIDCGKGKETATSRPLLESETTS